MVYSVLISVSVAVPLATWAAHARQPDVRPRHQAGHDARRSRCRRSGSASSSSRCSASASDWFPASGLREGVLPYIWSLTLPACTIALYLSPVLVRSLRTTMIAILRTDYVEAARARGLSEARVMRRYVLRNSLTSTVTMIGLSVAGLIGGSIIVENVFALPGHRPAGGPIRRPDVTSRCSRPACCSSACGSSWRTW